MKKIKYVGPFYQVRAEDFLFTRHLAVSVPDLVAQRLLSSDNFEEVVPDPVPADPVEA